MKKITKQTSRKNTTKRRKRRLRGGQDSESAFLSDLDKSVLNLFIHIIFITYQAGVDIKLFPNIDSSRLAKLLYGYFNYAKKNSGEKTAFYGMLNLDFLSYFEDKENIKKVLDEMEGGQGKIEPFKPILPTIEEDEDEDNDEDEDEEIEEVHSTQVLGGPTFSKNFKTLFVGTLLAMFPKNVGGVGNFVEYSESENPASSVFSLLNLLMGKDVPFNIALLRFFNPRGYCSINSAVTTGQITSAQQTLMKDYQDAIYPPSYFTVSPNAASYEKAMIQQYKNEWEHVGNIMGVSHFSGEVVTGITLETYPDTASVGKKVELIHRYLFEQRQFFIDQLASEGRSTDLAKYGPIASTFFRAGHALSVILLPNNGLLLVDSENTPLYGKTFEDARVNRNGTHDYQTIFYKAPASHMVDLSLQPFEEVMLSQLQEFMPQNSPILNSTTDQVTPRLSESLVKYLTESYPRLKGKVYSQKSEIGIYAAGDTPFLHDSNVAEREIITFKGSISSLGANKPTRLRRELWQIDDAYDPTITNGYTLKGEPSGKVPAINQWKLIPPNKGSGSQFKMPVTRLPGLNNGTEFDRPFLRGIDIKKPAGLKVNTADDIVKILGKDAAVGVDIDEDALNNAWEQVHPKPVVQMKPVPHAQPATSFQQGNNSNPTFFQKINATCQSFIDGTSEFFANNQTDINEFMTIGAGMAFSLALNGLVQNQTTIGSPGGNSSVPSIGYGGNKINKKLSNKTNKKSSNKTNKKQAKYIKKGKKATRKK